MRKHTRALERVFTVVNWDQRGAAKSFAAARGCPMTMEQFVDDIIDLSSYLTRRFHKSKVLLVGHSWGSSIGMLAASRRPDLFSAYVGIGQVSSMPDGELLSYQWTLEEARGAGDEPSVRKLVEIGPPPYGGDDWRAKFMTERRILAKHGGEYWGSKVGAMGVVLENLVLSREYTLLDRINFFRGIFRSADALYRELAALDLFTAVPKLDIPVYFCLGRHDYEVPSVLSAKYFASLQAPSKQLVWFESSAHMPYVEEKEKFERFMIDVVLPAIQGRELSSAPAE
jgi:pimeloyl-ACP methyl ester carboxylesterase